MPSEYISKRARISKLLEAVLEKVDSIDRSQFNLMVLRDNGASEGLVDAVLQTYADAGELIVTNQTIEKRKKKTKEEAEE